MSDRHYDVRTAKRYLEKGAMSQEEYEARLAALPDLAEECEFVDYQSKFQAEDEQVIKPGELPPIPSTSPAPPVFNSQSGLLPPIPTSNNTSAVPHYSGTLPPIPVSDAFKKSNS